MKLSIKFHSVANLCLTSRTATNGGSDRIQSGYFLKQLDAEECPPLTPTTLEPKEVADIPEC